MPAGSACGTRIPFRVYVCAYLYLVFLPLAAIFMLGHIKAFYAVTLHYCGNVSLTLVQTFFLYHMRFLGNASLQKPCSLVHMLPIKLLHHLHY